MTWTYYERLPRFNTLRIHLSRDLLLLGILIFVKFIKEIILCVALRNASAEGTCSWLIFEQLMNVMTTLGLLP